MSSIPIASKPSLASTSTALGQLNQGSVLETTISAAVHQGGGDFSGSQCNSLALTFPWLNPTLQFTDLTVFGIQPSWSPSGEYLAVPNGNSPGFYVYQHSGINFNKVFAASSGDSGYGSGWSPDGQFLIFTDNNGNNPVYIYQRSGSVFTFLSNPVFINVGSNTGGRVAWSPSGEYVCIGTGNVGNSPYIAMYQRSGTTFTLLPNAVTCPPPSDPNYISWSPDGEYLTVAHSTTPFLTTYRFKQGNLYKMSDPSSLPAGACVGCAWSPNSRLLALAHNTSPFVTVYKRTSAGLRKLSAPSSLPPAGGRGIAWSPDGQYLGIANAGSPNLTVYNYVNDVFTKLPDAPAISSSPNNLAWSPDGQYLSVVFNGSTPGLAIYQTGVNMPSSGIIKVQGLKRASESNYG